MHGWHFASSIEVGMHPYIFVHALVVVTMLWWVRLLFFDHISVCWCSFFLQQKCSVQRKLSDKMLVWLSVWNLVHIVCIWSSWCHCHPKTLLSFATFKSRLILSFWYWLNQVVLEKRPLNRCSCCSISYIQCRCVWISVLWRCWLGSRKGIRPVKTEWSGAGMVISLERVADLHMAQLMPLPLTVLLQ